VARGHDVTFALGDAVDLWRILRSVGRTSPPSQNDRADVAATLAWLERRGSKKNREGMARYGITAEKVFGVSVGELRAYAKRLGRRHSLALALWDTGCYEGRMLAAFVDEPAEVTPVQMDRWCRDFDSWALCDTVCFHLFDHTPHAFTKVKRWAGRKDEFVRRAAFALLASLAVHDRRAEDAAFLACLPLVEHAATDPRNFVKKGVSWALRSVGQRSLALHAEATTIARRLAARPDAAARWVGKDALRDLERPMVAARLAKRAARRQAPSL
jgi:3-methyladenine DNA glycosylase AlkD